MALRAGGRGGLEPAAAAPGQRRGGAESGHGEAVVRAPTLRQPGGVAAADRRLGPDPAARVSQHRGPKPHGGVPRPAPFGPGLPGGGRGGILEPGGGIGSPQHVCGAARGGRERGHLAGQPQPLRGCGLEGQTGVPVAGSVPGGVAGPGQRWGLLSSAQSRRADHRADYRAGCDPPSRAAGATAANNHVRITGSTSCRVTLGPARGSDKCAARSPRCARRTDPAEVISNGKIHGSIVGSAMRTEWDGPHKGPYNLATRQVLSIGLGKIRLLSKPA